MSFDVQVVDSEDEEEIRRMRERSRKRPRVEIVKSAESPPSTSARTAGIVPVPEKLPRQECSETGEAMTIEQLSDDILVNIFQKLGKFPQFAIVLGVCRRWKRLGSDPRLWTTLNFSNFEHVADETVQYIFGQGRAIKNLKSLSLAKCHNLSEAAVRQIPKSACVNSLQSIDLSWCSGASARSILDFSRCPGLREVRLSYCRDVPGRAVKILANRCPRLEVLDLNCCSNIRNSHIVAIAENCPKLRYLNIANSQNVTDSAICTLAQKCSNLEVLNLSWCSKITDKSLNAVADALPKLRELGLNETQATNVGLDKVVRSCSNLEQLHLARCAIGDCGAASIAVNCSTNLKILNLASCEEVSDGAVRFILFMCTALTMLDVSSLPCRQIGGLLSLVSRHVTVYF